ncbi:hypothetical protein FOA52_013315 [Chlamydomonas sp. UWO 241]|nr:hypothetical protein FOA52_013315 [Chlamydomonas sp. UWO 241]
MLYTLHIPPYTDEPPRFDLLDLMATQAGECVIGIKVLEETGSGGNTVQVAGVLVGEEGGAQLVHNPVSVLATMERAGRDMAEQIQRRA